MKKLLFIILVLFSASANAATIHVPSEQTTIQAGIDAAVNGDTVLVSAGEYHETLNFLGKNIIVTSNNDIEEAIIYGSVTFENFENRTAKLLGFSFIGSFTIGIADGSSPIISNNKFYNITASGVIIYTNSNPLIEKNLFYNNIVGHACIGVGGGRNAIIRNNTFSGNSRGFYSFSPNTIAINNIVISSNNYGVYGSYSYLDYNVIWDNGINYDGGASAGFNDLDLNPGLIDEDNLYALSSSSPCIDAGHPDPQYNDPDGTRNDIGAFYYSQQGTSIRVPQDFATIQQAIDALTVADSIIVSSGTYHENLNSNGKSFHLIGESGRESTIIESSIHGLPIFSYTDENIEQGIDSDTMYISGITFQNCNDAIAVKISYGSKSHKVKINSCKFEDNYGLVLGGCISSVHNGERNVYITNCIFSYNEGNVISLVSDLGCTIEDSYFIGNSGTLINTTVNDFFASFNLARNTFKQNSGEILVDIEQPVGNITSNVFDSNSVSNYLIKAADFNQGGSQKVDSNLFTNNFTELGLISINARKSLLIDYNTFAYNSYNIEGCVVCSLYSKRSRYWIRNNIVSNNLNAIGIELDTGEYSEYYEVQNNDSWENELGNFALDVDSNLNISANPMFCNPSIGNYYIAQESPALGMGPIGEGCSAADTLLSIMFPNELDKLHLTNHQPLIAWKAYSPFKLSQTHFQIEVGENADLWNTGQIESSDTSIIYDGGLLSDGETYNIRIRVNNSFAWSDWFETQFRMNSVPNVPMLVLPDSNGLMLDNPPILTVMTDDVELDNIIYTIQVSINPSFTFPFIDTGSGISGAETQIVIDSLLSEHSMYYWRTKGSDGYEESEYSESGIFWVNAINEIPLEFSLTEPGSIDSDTIIVIDPTFFWNLPLDPDPFDTVKYTLYIAIDEDFVFSQSETGIIDTSHTLSFTLDWDTDYWWKVKAYDLYGGETWSSEVYQFFTFEYICVDSDSDGYGDPEHPENDCPQDNCYTVYNPDQEDLDSDLVGDSCDNCIDVFNEDQIDGDNDGTGDLCDVCPFHENNDCCNPIGSNLPPEITSSISISVAPESEGFTYIAEASDPNCNTSHESFSLEIINYPSWCNLVDQTITGLPDCDEADSSFWIIANDGDLADTQIVFITIDHSNQIPIITDTISSVEVKNGMLFEYYPAIDDDDTEHIITYTNYPHWCYVQNDSVLGIAPDTIFIEPLTVIVEDFCTADTHAFLVSVFLCEEGSQFTISGYVTDGGGLPIADVLMTGLPCDPLPLTDGSGYYSCLVDCDWSGTVTPEKYNCLFTPESNTYTNVISNFENQDYTIDCNVDPLEHVWFVSEIGSNETGDGSFGNPFATIIYAIDSSGAQDYDTIRVLEGTYDAFEISKPIVLEAPLGAQMTFIDGENLNRCITIYQVEGVIEIKGFTLTNGVGQGGALSSYRTDILLEDCYITNNSSTTSGGALSFRDSSYFEIRDCHITQNTADQSGGGIVAVNARGGIIENTLIDNNTAIINSGGVFLFASSEDYTTDYEITNCTFVMNTGGEGGSAIGVLRNNLDINKSILYMNYWDKCSGCADFSYGLYSALGSLSINCCLLYLNQELDLYADNIIDSSNVIWISPQFCNPLDYNFEISSNSLCAPANNECSELIGALPVGCDLLCGDVDDSDTYDIGDAYYLINYIFNFGTSPIPYELNGDVDNDGSINIGDAVYLINYIFYDGCVPCESCI